MNEFLSHIMRAKRSSNHQILLYIFNTGMIHVCNHMELSLSNQKLFLPFLGQYENFVVPGRTKILFH